MNPDDFKSALLARLGLSPAEPVQPGRSQQPGPYQRLVQQVAPLETTRLTPTQELAFRRWAAAQHITDVDEPDAHYDYRGFWLNGGQHASSNGHFPDTYKQHGHPTFSVESRYSLAPNDGGHWTGEQFTAPSPADSQVTMTLIRALLAKRKGHNEP